MFYESRMYVSSLRYPLHILALSVCPPACPPVRLSVLKGGGGITPKGGRKDSIGKGSTHPSCPASTSLNLSARTPSIALSFAALSVLMGIWAAIPPMAWTPRLWHVWISSLT